MAIRQLQREKTIDTDFFKGIAIILVVLTHTHQPFSDLPMILKNFLSFFQMGTQVFLILSCFGLCFSYKKNHPTYFAFLKHRLFKIGLGYWIAVFVYVIAAFLSNIIMGINIIGNRIDPIAVICNLLMIHGVVWAPDINNGVVFGGWFVGTIVCFYILFPFLYRIYFSEKFVWWTKARVVVFPFCVQLLSFAFVYSIGLINRNFFCGNNTFMYFNIINQLPCLSLGFSLFDIVEKKMVVKASLIKSITCIVASAFLFFSKFDIAFILVPFIFGSGFLYLFAFSVGLRREKTLKENIVMKFGRFSFGIYLFHILLAYGIAKILLQIIGIPLNNQILYLFAFIIVIVIVFLVSYLIGKLFYALTNWLYRVLRI